MTLPRFVPGQSAKGLFSARTLNELARGVERSSWQPGSASQISRSIVLVKNSSGSALNLYCPVGIGECLNPVTSGYDGIEVPPLLFDSAEPADTRLWGITQEALDVDQIGEVLIWGPTWARLDGAVPATHSFAALGGGTGAYDALTVSGDPGRFEVMHLAGDTGYAAGVLLPQAHLAMAWGDVIGAAVDDETGLAKVNIKYATNSVWVGKDVWVADYLGQIIKDEPSADIVGRSVIIQQVDAELDFDIITKTLESSATVTRGPKWLCVAANCPTV